MGVTPRIVGSPGVRPGTVASSSLAKPTIWAGRVRDGSQAAILRPSHLRRVAPPPAEDDRSTRVVITTGTVLGTGPLVVGVLPEADGSPGLTQTIESGSGKGMPTRPIFVWQWV